MTRRSTSPNFSMLFFAAILICAIAFFGLWAAAAFTPLSAESSTACVVTDKDRSSSSEGESIQRVYTENCGIFEVRDSLIRGHFNSADVYSKIEAGKTYDFEGHGFRIGLFSMFPNIIRATEV